MSSGQIDLRAISGRTAPGEDLARTPGMEVGVDEKSMRSPAATEFDARERVDNKGDTARGSAWRRMKRDKYAMMGVTIVAIYLLIMLFAPLLAPHDPYAMDVHNIFRPPFFMQGGGMDFPLGTDELGRDLLSRLMFGMRLSIFMSFCVVVLIVGFGTLIGLLSAYYGKWVNMLLMRVTDIQLSFPVVILAVGILSVTTPTVAAVIAVLAIGNWPVYARVVRGLALGEKGKDYVKAAQALGASDIRVMAKYILMNIVPTILVVSILDLAAMVIWEAVLGFIGLSVLPPTPTLGNIMGAGKNYMVNAWWVPTLPGVVVFFFLFGLSLLGEGIAGATGVRGQGQVQTAI